MYKMRHMILTVVLVLTGCTNNNGRRVIDTTDGSTIGYTNYQKPNQQGCVLVLKNNFETKINSYFYCKEFILKPE